MDKASERRKDSKRWGDTDIGVHDYGAGGRREQLDGLWAHAGKEVVGLDTDRLMTNCYCKETGDKGGGGDSGELADSIISSGPPLLNVSKPKQVF